MNWQNLAGPQRLKNMQSAIQLLIQWQKATYQLPLLENPNAFYHEKERIAALLVDNHLGKLARKVRLLGAQDGLDAPTFLNEWAEVAFFTSLWARFDNLSDGLKLNLLYHSGANITKKHLSDVQPIVEKMMVVGQDFAQEERLLRRSVYFYGLAQKKYYQLLEYSFNQQPFDQIFQVGESYEGEVVQYPLERDFRISTGKWNKISGSGLVDQIETTTARFTTSGFHSALKINPFCEPYPAFMMLSSDYQNGEWYVFDPEGYTVNMETMEADIRAKFYAVCFRNPVRVFVLCSREGVLPMSHFNGEYLVEIVERVDKG